MHKVVADIPRNRLYMTLSGAISTSEAEEIASRVIRETASLTPGYAVINNLTYYKSAISFFASKPALAKVMLHFRDSGVTTIIRVVGGSKSAILEFAQATLGINKQYPVIYVPTLEDAEKRLDEIYSRSERVPA